MASSTRQALLKVVTGPHAGAELLLSEGPNSIGSDDSCDIVLVDPQLAGRHAVLTVTGGAVTVEPAEGQEVLVDGKPSARTTLRPFQYVTVGTTHLAIGPAHETWPALSAPTVTPVPASTASDPAGKVAEEPGAAAVRPESNAAPVSVAAVAPVRDRRRGVLAVLAAAIALMAFVLLWNPFGRSPALATQNSPGDIRRQVDWVLKKFSDGTDLRIDEKARTLTVAGYVPTLERRRELATALESIPGSVRLSVVDMTSLVEAAGRVLAMHDADFAKASAGKPGEVVISGTTSNLTDWKRVKSKVAADVPSIRTLTDRVNSPSAPQPALSPVVEMQPVEVPVPPQPALEPVVESTAPSPEPTAVRLAIRSITIGQYRSLVLESGEKVFEGATLAGGYVVKSIAADRVVLNRMGQDFVVRVGGSR